MRKSSLNISTKILWAPLIVCANNSKLGLRIDCNLSAVSGLQAIQGDTKEKREITNWLGLGHRVFGDYFVNNDRSNNGVSGKEANI